MSESREEKSVPGGQRTPPATLIGTPDAAIGHLFPPYTDAKNEELKQWLD
jgi:hypothetical protein